MKLSYVHEFTHMLFTYMNMGLVTIYNSISMYTIYVVTEDQIFTLFASMTSFAESLGKKVYAV